MAEVIRFLPSPDDSQSQDFFLGLCYIDRCGSRVWALVFCYPASYRPKYVQETFVFRELIIPLTKKGLKRKGIIIKNAALTVRVVDVAPWATQVPGVR